MIFGKDKI